jgi:hypothetical protein
MCYKRDDQNKPDRDSGYLPLFRAIWDTSDERRTGTAGQDRDQTRSHEMGTAHHSHGVLILLQPGLALIDERLSE